MAGWDVSTGTLAGVGGSGPGGALSGAGRSVRCIFVGWRDEEAGRPVVFRGVGFTTFRILGSKSLRSYGNDNLYKGKQSVESRVITMELDGNWY